MAPSYLIGKLLTYFKSLKIINEDEQYDDIECILQDDGIAYLAERLRKRRTNMQDDNDRDKRDSLIFRDLYHHYYDNDERRRILELIKTGAYYENTEREYQRKLHFCCTERI